MAGGSGGAWKVAYADFVTAMMAFFMVMWITAQSKPVKQAVANYFEDPLGVNQGSKSTSFIGPEDAATSGMFESGRGPGRGLAMTNHKAEGRRNSVGVSAVKPPRMIIFRHFNRTHSIGTAASFAEDSADLDAAAEERIKLLVPLLLGKPNKVEIRSYTAPIPLPPGSRFTDSWQLNHARSQAAMKFLIALGIDAKRIRICLDAEPETDDLVDQSGAQVPGSRVQIFALDEYVGETPRASPPPKEAAAHDAHSG